MKRFLISAVIAAALGSPALAQAYDPDLGTGNIVNVEPVQPTVMQAYASAQRKVVRRHAAPRSVSTLAPVSAPADHIPLD